MKCQKCKGYGEYADPNIERTREDPYGDIVLCSRCKGTGIEPERLGSRPVMSGTHEKDMDTGEVTERPCYSHIDEFPG